MNIPPDLPRLKGLRYPRKIIAYAIWVYHRFAMSTADVEDLLAQKGVIVSREAIRLWVNRLGQPFAQCIRRDRPRSRDKWHMDEVVIMIRGRKHWLWRAIEVSHRPTRKREKIFGRFKSHRQAQRLLSAHDQINLIFRPRRKQLGDTNFGSLHRVAHAVFGIDVAINRLLADPQFCPLKDHTVTDLLWRPAVLKAINYALAECRVFDQFAISCTPVSLHQMCSGAVIAITSWHALITEMIALQLTKDRRQGPLHTSSVLFCAVP